MVGIYMRLLTNPAIPLWSKLPPFHVWKLEKNLKIRMVYKKQGGKMNPEEYYVFKE